jgi:hypothetical protein
MSLEQTEIREPRLITGTYTQDCHLWRRTLLRLRIDRLGQALVTLVTFSIELGLSFYHGNL